MKPLDPNHADNYPASDNNEYPDWRQACPKCSECGRPINEDAGCQDADCLAEQMSNHTLDFIYYDEQPLNSEQIVKDVSRHIRDARQTVTILELRAAILDVLDAGSEAPGYDRRAWLFYLDESDEQTDTRMRFVDAVQARLNQLNK